jgi:hypothetical protein
LVSQGWPEKVGDTPFAYYVYPLVGQNKDTSLSQNKAAASSKEEPVTPPVPIKKEKPPVPPKKPARLTQQVCNGVVPVMNMDYI